MKKVVIIIVALFVVGFLYLFLRPFYHANNRQENAVLEVAKDTAIAIYGYWNIRKETPLIISSETDSTWIVEGTFPYSYISGGTVYVEVSKNTMKPIYVIHSK